MTQEKPQKISLLMATIAGVNAMIGASIFINPASLQVSVGPAAVVTYIGVIAAVWIMALALARVAALYPQAGAFYTYASAWGGHTMGVIASVSYLCGLTLAMGLLTRLIGMYLSYYVPALPHTALSLIVLWSLIALTMAGASLTKIGQMILLILTIAPVLLIIGLCASKASVSNLTPFMPHGYTSLVYAIKAVIFGFFGFETATSLYNLVDQPEKNVPRALTYSIIIVGALYISFITAIFLALPRSVFTSAEIPLSEALLAVFPEYTWLVDLLRASIIITIMGTLHALIWSLSELLCATIHRARKRVNLIPTQAVLLIGAIVSFNTLVFKNLGLFFNFCSIFLVFSFSASIAALLWGPATLRQGPQSRKTKLLGVAGLTVALFIMGVAFFEVISLVTR